MYLRITYQINKLVLSQFIKIKPIKFKQYWKTIMQNTIIQNVMWGKS